MNYSHSIVTKLSEATTPSAAIELHDFTEEQKEMQQAATLRNSVAAP